MKDYTTLAADAAGRGHRPEGKVDKAKRQKQKEKSSNANGHESLISINKELILISLSFQPGVLLKAF